MILDNREYISQQNIFFPKQKHKTWKYWMLSIFILIWIHFSSSPINYPLLKAEEVQHHHPQHQVEEVQHHHTPHQTEEVHHHQHRHIKLKKLWNIVMLVLLLEDQLQRLFLLFHIVTIVPRSFSPWQLLPSLTLLHILVTTLCSPMHTLLSLMLPSSPLRSNLLPSSLLTTQVLCIPAKPHQRGLDITSHRISSQGQALQVPFARKKLQWCRQWTGRRRRKGRGKADRVQRKE
jgi:hypothetical protein